MRMRFDGRQARSSGVISQKPSMVFMVCCFAANEAIGNRLLPKNSPRITQLSDGSHFDFAKYQLARAVPTHGNRVAKPAAHDRVRPAMPHHHRHAALPVKDKLIVANESRGEEHAYQNRRQPDQRTLWLTDATSINTNTGAPPRDERRARARPRKDRAPGPIRNNGQIFHKDG